MKEIREVRSKKFDLLSIINLVVLDETFTTELTDLIIRIVIGLRDSPKAFVFQPTVLNCEKFCENKSPVNATAALHF